MRASWAGAILLPLFASALDNGLGATPPMGWSSWNAAGSTVNASYVKAVAQYMKNNGFRGIGWKYINVDEGWMLGRDPQTLAPIADPAAFPDGMDGLGKSIHDLGFLYGLYTSRGTSQCARPEYQRRCLHTPPNPKTGCEGSHGYERGDGSWLVGQGADFIKEDSCGGSQDHATAFADYANMRDSLNATGKQVWFSLCGWHPWYAPPDPSLNYTGGASLGNSWRIDGDGKDWGALSDAVNTMATLTNFTGPGGWSDPDLLIGPTCNIEGVPCGQTDLQARTQFSLWALFPAPLLISQDVLGWSAFAEETYQNSAVTAINQDKLGKAAVRLQGDNLSFPCAAAPGTDVKVVPCVQGDRSQMWTFVDGYFSLQSDPATVLDVGACVLHNGKRRCALSMRPKVSSENQTWSINDDGTVARNARCLDVWKGNKLSAVNRSVSLFPCNGGSNQQWRLEYTGGHMLNQESGRCLVASPPAILAGSATCTNVWGRTLSGSRLAFVFVNNGAQQTNVTCGPACFSQLPMPAAAYQIQDVWDLMPIPPNIQRGPGGFSYTATVPGQGGSRMFELMAAN